MLLDVWYLHWCSMFADAGVNNTSTNSRVNGELVLGHNFVAASRGSE